MMGRPTIITTETVAKLRQAFMMGCSDREACVYAEIGLQTLYDYQKKNIEFSEQKRAFKVYPKIRARKTIFDNLGDIKTAQWYLERKYKKEFGLANVKQQNSGLNNYVMPKKLSNEEKLEIEQILFDQIEAIESSSTSL